MPVRRPGESYASFQARMAAWVAGGAGSGAAGPGSPVNPPESLPGMGIAQPGQPSGAPPIPTGAGTSAAAGGGGGAGAGPEFTTTNRNVVEDETINRTRTSNVNRQVRRYVDVPTPEEFLDDFRTGMSTYLKGLGGAVSRNAGMWLMENMDMFLNDYLGDLGARAARGEQVFKVVGATGAVTPLGSRPGQSIQQTTAGQTVQGTQGTQVTNTQATQQQGGQTQQVGGQTTQTTQGTQTINDLENENINETENIFSRPNLTTVKTISPMDFMAANWTPASLNIRYEGFKGARQARARTAQGVTSVRRVV